jgi:hypothetical protein
MLCDQRPTCVSSIRWGWRECFEHRAVIRTFSCSVDGFHCLASIADFNHAALAPIRPCACKPLRGVKGSSSDVSALTGASRSGLVAFMSPHEVRDGRGHDMKG